MLKVLLFLYSVFCFNWIFATSQKTTFEKFPNQNFVETGSNIGDVIENAKNVKFQNIYSIEISQKLYNLCKKRFKIGRASCRERV